MKFKLSYSISILNDDNTLRAGIGHDSGEEPISKEDALVEVTRMLSIIADAGFEIEEQDFKS